MKTITYARVSSKEQEQEGYSIPAQLKLLMEYASKNGLVSSRNLLTLKPPREPGGQILMKC
jgi:DNA invertase Pin-like site-specific DNA recombinase